MTKTTTPDPTPTDFDFLAGEWRVANRRLKDFLDPASEWEEFPATSRGTRHFDGGASFDEIEFPTLGSGGLTLRLYDRQTGLWSLYWASRRTGTLFPPVTGSFGPDGVGLFHGEDTHDGRPVRVRFVWSGITGDAARWEQSFSADGEQTWLVNWTMHFTRT
ncbi:hypothetical protein [Streptomyces sp. NPDC086023]|uniref:hypothetical protein n=1 Tax=Streptomyces sp. NPDC086023 TaxID=3365746 RepID=UPI0037CD73CC